MREGCNAPQRTGKYRTVYGLFEHYWDAVLCMDALNSMQPGAFARCGCGMASCVEGCKVSPQPEPEPEQAAPAPKRGMLTREEAEEMAEKTAEDIAAAKAAEALERERELAAEVAQEEADAAAFDSPLAALDAFSAEQLRRVAAYRDLAEALRVLLDRGDLFKYQKTCAGITAEFAGCSRRIMAISKNLRTRLAGGATAARIIDDIQSGEERKLQLTVAIQVWAVDLVRLRAQWFGRSIARPVWLTTADRRAAAQGSSTGGGAGHSAPSERRLRGLQRPSQERPARSLDQRFVAAALPGAASVLASSFPHARCRARTPLAPSTLQMSKRGHPCADVVRSCFCVVRRRWRRLTKSLRSCGTKGQSF